MRRGADLERSEENGEESGEESGKENGEENGEENNEEDSEEDSEEIDLPGWNLIYLSIATLANTLQEVAYRLYVRPKDWEQYKWGDHPLIAQRLEAGGWCKADVKRFMRTEALDFLIHVGAIKSPRRFEDHTHCTDMVCRGSFII